MISDADRYYGAVLSTVVDSFGVPVCICNVSTDVAGFYLINDSLPLYIKYATSRKGPWTFTFQKRHQELLESFYVKYSECIIAFVCGKDGIAALIHSDLRKILDTSFEEQEAVTIRRKRNEMYRVKGRDGILERKLSRNSLDEILKEKNGNRLVLS